MAKIPPNSDQPNTGAQRPWLPGQIPLLIGVTGHREIRESDLEALRTQVRAALRALQKQYPSTPFAILTPLAEGGDRLVAQVATEPEFNARLIVPLPLRRSLYEEDFRGTKNTGDGNTSAGKSLEDHPSLTPLDPECDTSIKEFRKLIDSSSTRWFEVSNEFLTNQPETATAASVRSHCYAAASAFVVRNCQILFALWDEIENPDIGGAAATKNFKLHGIPRGYLPPERASGAIDLGPVYHFFTPRKGSTQPPASKVEMRKLFPRSHEYHEHDEGDRFFSERILQPLEDFNREIVAAESGEGQADLSSQLELMPRQLLNKQFTDVERGNLIEIERIVSSADRLSLHFQPRTQGTAILLSLLVGFAALSLDVSSHILNGRDQHLVKFTVMAFFPLLMLVAFLIFRIARNARFQDKYQDYRALAEGLRVQFFWQAAGIKEPVAENYLPSVRSELYWINHACRAVNLLYDTAGRRLDLKHTELVVEYWVKDQLKYYEKSRKRNHHRLHLWEWIINFLFLSGLGVAIAVSLAGIGHEFHWFHGWIELKGGELSDHTSPLHLGAMLYIIMSAVCAALSHSWVQRVAYEEHVKQFSRMIRIFKDHLKEIKALVEAEDFESIKTELLNLGREALMENSAWVLTHRERPLEIPHH